MSSRFQYWPRYISRLLGISAEYRGDLILWKVECLLKIRKRSYDFEQKEGKSYPFWSLSNDYPWNFANRLSDFPFKDIEFINEYQEIGTLPTFDPYKANIFNGDFVMILAGKDKGKIGIVKYVLKMSNMVIVNGLNIQNELKQKQEGKGVIITGYEQPLHILNEVCLIDPQTNQPCEAEWLFDEDGNKLRVNKSTGRVIPLPERSVELDNGTLPFTEVDNPDTDTTKADAVKTTYQPNLKLFVDDICQQQGIEDNRQRAKTYWY